MISLHSALIAFLGLSICVLGEKKLPSFVEKCKRSDPDLNECMKKAILSFKPHLEKGVKGLKIPSLDPFYLKRADIEVDFAKAALLNVSFHMANNYELKDFKIDLDAPTVWMNITFPYMEMDCIYTAEGKIVNIPFHGEGKMISNFTNTNLTSVIRGEKFTKDDQVYIEWKTDETKILQDSLDYFYLTDLFQNNPELNDRFLAIIKEHQKELTPDVIPLVAHIYGQVFRSLLNGPFTTFSLKELFDD
ncbi:hypothetical protein Trydic_g493 [Trypoxylus dichotomus]